MNMIHIRPSTGFLALLCILGIMIAGCVPIPATVAPSDAPAPTAAPIPAPTTAPTAVPSVTASAYWPTNGWRTSTPEEQGMDAQKLAAMLAEIKERKIDIRSLLVIRNGYLVSETYFVPFLQHHKQDMQSVGRSFTATLVGIAIDKGYIAGVDQKILEFFPDRTFANLDAQKKAMTLEDVLTMRSGLEPQPEDPYYRAMQDSPDWIQFLLDLPVTDPPGSRWNYCAGCSHILTAILQNTTGMNPRDFAEQYLFKPLGISAGRWMSDPAGLPYGAGGFNLMPSDMAKLGYLYLHKGQWDGQQIISPEWVETSTQPHADVDVNAHFGYGYHWFTVPEMEGYAALGGGGQIILVIPRSDLVIVTTAKTEESLFELFDKYILPAVQK
jgi:CubicO group peptidase (beta-lactamase class C family)